MSNRDIRIVLVKPIASIFVETFLVNHKDDMIKYWRLEDYIKDHEAVYEDLLSDNMKVDNPYVMEKGGTYLLMLLINTAGWPEIIDTCALGTEMSNLEIKNAAELYMCFPS